MGLHNLKPATGSVRSRKRVGRGPGSGLGKTAGRGEKGQKSRSGFARKPGFEGGQMPLQRRLPKRGFKNPFRKEWEIVNLRDLADFPDGTVVDVEILKTEGLVNKAGRGVKILGEGEITRPLTVRAHGFSLSAKRKIEAAGGKVEVI